MHGSAGDTVVDALRRCGGGTAFHTGGRAAGDGPACVVAQHRQAGTKRRRAPVGAHQQNCVTHPCGRGVPGRLPRRAARSGAAVARARRVSLGRLVLAACPGTASGLLGRLVQDGSGLLQPDVLFTHDRPGALRDGRADAALLCRDRDDLTGLHTVEIAEEDPVVLLPRRHDLARHTTLHSTELRDDPHWMDQCPPVGLDELVDRVVLGQLVTVVGSAATCGCRQKWWPCPSPTCRPPFW
ncbi:hypothetical protein E4K10_45225 [Streptomyces sp. T1317-0309]|nr:hypothetical protein E4K10_45225 [Streptomyces sp. T1317-0309]